MPAENRTESFIKSTKGICDKCGMVVDAEVFIRGSRVWLRKRCEKDGVSECPHLIAIPEIYRCLQELHEKRSAPPEGLIIKLTSKCNQDCPYCFSCANQRIMEEPSCGEVMRIASGFKGGVIYLSGGEPTLRNDIFEIIKKLKKKKFKVIMFTNGKKLAEESYVRSLKKSGLDCAILQFDSLSDEDSLKIRGEKLVGTKVKAVENLQKCAIFMMLYVNVVDGVNNMQVKSLFEFCAAHNRVKILFFNPLWNIGRRATTERLDSEGMLDTVNKELGLKRSDFIDSIRFSTYLFEVLRKAGLRKGVKEPPCSVSCYFYHTEKKPLLFATLFDINRAGLLLRRIDGSLSPRPKDAAANLLRLLFKPDLYRFLSLFLFNARFLKVMSGNLLRYLKNPGEFNGLYFMFFDVLSVMVGQFPDAKRMDFSLMRTCNMHTNLKGKKNLPTCLCEIINDREDGRGESLEDIVP